MASGLRPRPYLSAFRVFGCASGATGLHIIFMRYRGWFIFGYASMNHPRLFVCRPPDSQIRLAELAGWRRQTPIFLPIL